jgi:hypothetical protein
MWYKINGSSYYFMGDIMLKKLFGLMKRLIVAVLLIYAYNNMALPLNLFIPMNFFTLALVILFGMPSILMIILFSLVCI